jgi:hypothetical protein
MCAIALTGCATGTVEQVQNTPSGELCQRIATGRTAGLPSSVFYRELDRRNEDCSRYQAAIQNQIRADAAQTASGLMLLQMARPQPRQAMNCNSYKLGNTIQTDCQ